MVQEHRRDHPGRAVGGGGDHAPQSCILFIDRQREAADPLVNGREVPGRFAHRRQPARPVGVRFSGQEFTIQGGRPALHIQASGQHPLGVATAVHAVQHHLKEPLHALVDLLAAADTPLVFVQEAGHGLVAGLGEPDHLLGRRDIVYERVVDGLVQALALPFDESPAQ